jgi:hypothetical protein
MSRWLNLKNYSTTQRISIMLVLLAVWWVVATKLHFTGGLLTYIVLVVWFVLFIRTVWGRKSRPSSLDQQRNQSTS